MSNKQYNYDYGENTSNDEYMDNLTNENEFLRSLLDSFWSGDVPNGATLDHMILAKAGRLRLAEKAKVCSLLGGNS